jgi:alkylation response protein AidB-like acyl-CoA dehydrogenase
MSEAYEMLTMLADQAERLLDDHATWEHLKSLLEAPGSFDHELWRQCAELGWPAAAIAETQGGLGLGLEALALLNEKLGARTVSLPLTPAAVIADAVAHGIGDHPAVTALAAGEQIGCLAFGEAGESGLPRTPALRFAGGALDGMKSLVPFAAIADVALCHASAEDGVALCLVMLDQPGVTREMVATLDNARAAATLAFTGAQAKRIDAGDGWTACLRAAAIASIVTAFEQVGGTQNCLSLGVEYAKERIVFGQPIGRFQAVKHKLSDIYTKLEIARGCAIDALAAAGRESATLPAMAAMARLGAIHAYEFASRETIQVYGGIGVTWEAAPQHHYRRSRALALELGAAPFWRELLVDNVFTLAEAEG